MRRPAYRLTGWLKVQTSGIGGFARYAKPSGDHRIWERWRWGHEDDNPPIVRISRNVLAPNVLADCAEPRRRPSGNDRIASYPRTKLRSAVHSSPGVTPLSAQVRGCAMTLTQIVAAGCHEHERCENRCEYVAGTIVAAKVVSNYYL